MWVVMYWIRSMHAAHLRISAQSVGVVGDVVVDADADADVARLTTL